MARSSSSRPVASRGFHLFIALCAVGALVTTGPGCKKKRRSNSSAAAAPSLVADFVSTLEDQSVVFEPLANDSGNGLSVSSISAPANGTLQDLGGGRFEYTPAPDFFGVENLTYTVVSADGVNATAGIEIEVAPQDDAPIAQDDAVQVDEDSDTTFDARANDVEVDGESLTIVAVGPATSGVATFTADTITYTPTADYCGPDSFTYDVRDDAGSVSTATVNVTVNCVNDAPVGIDDDAVALEGGTVRIDVLANDTDVDGDALTIAQIIAAPTLGVAQIDGDELRYDAMTIGIDTIVYELRDPDGATSTATVTIEVTDFSLTVGGAAVTASYDPRVGLGAIDVPVSANWDTAVALPAELTGFSVSIGGASRDLDPIGAIPGAPFDPSQGGISPDVWLVLIDVDRVRVTAELAAGDIVPLADEVPLFDAQFDLSAGTRGRPAGRMIALDFGPGARTIDTTEGTFTPAEQPITLDLTAIDLDAGFYFFAGGPRVSFDPAVGTAAFAIPLSIAEYGAAPATETQGFSIGLSVDSPFVALTDAAPTGPLGDLFGGAGPDFFGPMLYPDGVTIGVVYSFLGGTFLTFDPPAEVIRIDGETDATAVAGLVDPTDVPLEWSNLLGVPLVENIVVVNGQAIVPELIDGVLTLDPQ